MSLSPSDPVERLITGPPITVRAETNLVQAVELFAENEVGAVVIRGPHGPAGILSERDLITALVEGLDLDAESVGNVMSLDVATVQVDATIETAARAMLSGGMRHLPVVSGETFVGIVSIRDVLAVYVGD